MEKPEVTIDKEFLKQLTELAQIGLPDRALALSMGVKEAEFKRLLKEDKRVEQAVKLGRSYIDPTLREGFVSWYPNHADLKFIESRAALGETLQAISEQMGHGAGALTRKSKECPDILEAFARGEARALAFVTSRLYKLIEQNNPNAVMFFLKTRDKEHWAEQKRGDLIRPAVPATNQGTFKAPKTKSKDAFQEKAHAYAEKNGLRKENKLRVVNGSDED